MSNDPDAFIEAVGPELRAALLRLIAAQPVARECEMLLRSSSPWLEVYHVPHIEGAPWGWAIWRLTGAIFAIDENGAVDEAKPIIEGVAT